MVKMDDIYWCEYLIFEYHLKVMLKLIFKFDIFSTSNLTRVASETQLLVLCEVIKFDGLISWWITYAVNYKTLL